MGLDSYAMKVPMKYVISDFKVDRTFYDEFTEFAYWRKHHTLHNWFEDLYYCKGGKDESFNRIPVRITEEDLDRLEKVFLRNKKFHYSGYVDWDYEEADKSFIENARQAIQEGYAIYYDSWW